MQCTPFNVSPCRDAQTRRFLPDMIVGPVFNDPSGALERYRIPDLAIPWDRFAPDGVPPPDPARRPRPDARAARDAPSGRTIVLWRVPEVLSLKRIETDLRHRHMFQALPNEKPVPKRGIVTEIANAILPARLDVIA